MTTTAPTEQDKAFDTWIASFSTDFSDYRMPMKVAWNAGANWAMSQRKEDDAPKEAANE